MQHIRKFDEILTAIYDVNTLRFYVGTSRRHRKAYFLAVNETTRLLEALTVPEREAFAKYQSASQEHERRGTARLR